MPPRFRVGRMDEILHRNENAVGDHLLRESVRSFLGTKYALLRMRRAASCGAGSVIWQSSPMFFDSGNIHVRESFIQFKGGRCDLNGCQTEGRYEWLNHILFKRLAWGYCNRDGVVMRRKEENVDVKRAHLSIAFPLVHCSPSWSEHLKSPLCALHEFLRQGRPTPVSWL